MIGSLTEGGSNSQTRVKNRVALPLKRGMARVLATQETPPLTCLPPFLELESGRLYG